MLKQYLLWLIKVMITVVVGYAVLSTLLLGDESLNEKTGIYRYQWSGLDALWTDERFLFQLNHPATPALNGIDGPYVVADQQYSVNAQSELVSATLKPGQTLMVPFGNAAQDQFPLRLQSDISVEPTQYPQPSKMLAISDIEGNFAAFRQLLIANKVINAQYEWTFGDGHLVLNGDFVDRGDQVSAVLWLIYSLEEKAEQQQGKVHFILGNHEIMNMHGNVTDANRRYIAVAQRLSGDTHWERAGKWLYADHTELGRWLRSKNVAEKIGSYIFVHAGLRTEHLQQGLQLADLNRIARQYYGVSAEHYPRTAPEKYVLDPYHSPYWDRSLAMSWLIRATFLAYDPLHAELHQADQAEVDAILLHFAAEKIVIGHTVVNEITTDYAGKVINIDVRHAQDQQHAATLGLLVEQAQEYRVNGNGVRQPLFSGD